MNKNSQTDVKNKSQNWVYSDMVKDHFINPRHFVDGEEPSWGYDGMGEVGSPACGDVMRLWIKVDDGDRIVKCGWKTFGCASAIASTSVLAEKIVEDGGMVLAEAKKIKPKDIVGWLGGLPGNKIHCSVLGDQALRKTIADFERKQAER